MTSMTTRAGLAPCSVVLLDAERGVGLRLDNLDNVHTSTEEGMTKEDPLPWHLIGD
jgi:hypothetical protein